MLEKLQETKKKMDMLKTSDPEKFNGMKTDYDKVVDMIKEMGGSIEDDAEVEEVEVTKEVEVKKEVEPEKKLTGIKAKAQKAIEMLPEEEQEKLRVIYETSMSLSPMTIKVKDMLDKMKDMDAAIVLKIDSDMEEIERQEYPTPVTLEVAEGYGM
jgi:hypothetical protein